MNRDRMITEFLELVKIDSLSFKEREIVDVLKCKLQDMEIDVYEDNAGKKIGGNAGNLICTFKGEKDVPPILLMAHMDTVVPGTGKNPIIEGDVIRSDGTTILGGDDIAGVVCILQGLRVLQEKGIRHGDIQIVFSVAEEVGLLGSKNLDYEKIYAKYGFVLDAGGPIGTVAIKAPSHNEIKIIAKGKAAHAGIEPEKGVNAIEMVSHAISAMNLGRIDHETTANLGIINGGHARNIVCDRVEISAEARSTDEHKLEQQTDHMKECFENAAKRYGGTVEFESTKAYPAFTIDENEEIIDILKNAALDTGIELVLEATGGGSDTNIINGKGIMAVDLSVGMNKVHSVEEQININDMVKAVEFLVAIICSVK